MVVEGGLDTDEIQSPEQPPLDDVGRPVPADIHALSELPAMSTPPTATLIHHQSRR
jgi:hypothetical protein